MFVFLNTDTMSINTSRCNLFNEYISLKKNN